MSARYSRLMRRVRNSPTLAELNRLMVSATAAANRQEIATWQYNRLSKAEQQRKKVLLDAEAERYREATHGA